MPRRRHQSHTALHQQWVVGWLLFALPLLGLSASLSAMLGQMHFHRAVTAVTAVAAVVDNADSMAGWIDFRRALPKATEPAPAQPHSHGLFERHHHDGEDDTVVAVDAASHAADASTDGGASTSLAGLTLAMPPGMSWAVVADESRARPAGVGDAFATRTTPPPERPPKPAFLADGL